MLDGLLVPSPPVRFFNSSISNIHTDMGYLAAYTLSKYLDTISKFHLLIVFDRRSPNPQRQLARHPPGFELPVAQVWVSIRIDWAIDYGNCSKGCSICKILLKFAGKYTSSLTISLDVHARRIETQAIFIINEQTPRPQSAGLPTGV